MGEATDQEIALFVALSYVVGAARSDLYQLEVAAVTVSVLVVEFGAMDGESHWMEGICWSAST
ncbi:MAG: hypothetical protein ACREJU_12045 [Nitrospiraceae bacterium]